MNIKTTELKQIGRRIRERRRDLGMTQPELAALTGLSAPSVSKYENGKVSDASYAALITFAQTLRMSATELLGHTVSHNTGGEVALKKVPIIGKASAGAPLLAVEGHDEFVLVEESENVDFAVRVKGDSMINARIYDGDLVFAKRQPTVSNGEIAIIALDEGPDESYVTTKRFYRYGKTVVLRSENPVYKDIEITRRSGTNVRVVGKVVFLKAYIH